MYGTIARMKVKPGMMDKMIAWGKNQDPPGGGITIALRSDDDPNELFLVALAPDEESYRTRAASPEQHERYLEMIEYLETEPEWNDGVVVQADL